jgi:hypothetical protein
MNIEPQIERINNMRKQLELLEAELNVLSEQCKHQHQLEFEYPIYMQHRYGRQVIKFTDMHEGTVVVKGITKGSETVGTSSRNFVQHTNRVEWQPIVFDEERGIADKQLCECGNHKSYVRVLAFYDAVNKRTFSNDGVRIGYSWDNYRPISYAEWPDWAIEAESTLGD